MKGILPAGLSFDPDTGTISGTPSESAEARRLSVRGFGPSGEMGTYASVTLDVIEPRHGMRKQEFYGHTGKGFSAEITISGPDPVFEWSPVAELPDWASVLVLNGYLRGTPPSPGVWSVALSIAGIFGPYAPIVLEIYPA